MEDRRKSFLNIFRAAASFGPVPRASAMTTPNWTLSDSLAVKGSRAPRDVMSWIFMKSSKFALNILQVFTFETLNTC
jgi:hypothetical protein